MELLKKTAVEMRKALLAKEVSAVELVNETYKREMMLKKKSAHLIRSQKNMR